MNDSFAECNHLLLGRAQAKQYGVQWDAKFLNVIQGCGSALVAWRNGSSREATFNKCLQTIEMI